MGFVAAESFVPWLEMGRSALLKQHGFDYRQFEAMGYWLPVLEVAFQLHHPAFYDDELWLVTKLVSRPSFRIRLEYEIWRGDLLLVSAHTVQAFVNRSLRPVKPPAEFLAKLEHVFPRPARIEGGSGSGVTTRQNSTAGP